MSIGNTIAQKRKSRDMTQDTLAEAVNISRSMIAQIERGSKVPTVVLAKEIADVFNCKVDDLLSE